MIVAIGNTAWGRGNSKAEALRNARKNAPTFIKQPKFDVFETDDARCYVDEFGSLRSNAPIKCIAQGVA